VRKGRLDPGGFAYGELHESEPAMRESARSRRADTPLFRRGRIIWGIVITLLAGAALATILMLVLSES
jgi:hypothetical protein